MMCFGNMLQEYYVHTHTHTEETEHQIAKVKYVTTIQWNIKN